MMRSRAEYIRDIVVGPRPSSSSSYYGKSRLHVGCSIILSILLVIAALTLAGIPVILNFLQGVRTW